MGGPRQRADHLERHACGEFTRGGAGTPTPVDRPVVLRRLTLLAVFTLLVSAPQVVHAVAVDPKLFFEIPDVRFTVNNGGRGALTFATGIVTGVLYRDGTSTSTNTFEETVIGAEVHISLGPQSNRDLYTFKEGKSSAMTIQSPGGSIFVSGKLIDVTFDPGEDLTDGIVTLNLGFQWDNWIFTELNPGLGSRFIDEYAGYSSTTAGSVQLTLIAPGADTFCETFQGQAMGEFQIPEPGTLILLGSGLAGLAGYRRRRKQSRKQTAPGRASL